MKVGMSSIAASLACILMVTWLWKAVNWIWLRPKRLERCLRKQGFKGNSYRLLYGDKKETEEMLKLTTSKPMEHLSNDYLPRILPFLHQTINNYGEKSFIWGGPIPAVNITKPELIREVLMKVRDFQKPLVNPLVKKLSNGLSRLEGYKWAQQRKLITPAFHMEKLKHMMPAFYTSCHEMVDEWEKMACTKSKQTGPIELEVEIWSFLHNMSADAISRAAFGSSFEEGRGVFELIREQLAITVRAMHSVYIPGSRFLPTRTNRRIGEINREIQALLKDMIYRRKKAMEAGEAEKDDLLGILLKSSFESGNQNGHDQHLHGDNHNKQQKKIKLSLKEVIEECKLFYLAGQETTSGLLVWTLILLSKHQDWQEQAREEILNTFGINTPYFDGLNQLKKVNMILHEVLRLYPPATSLTREVTHDIQIGDHIHLPSGVLINLPLVYVHHNENLWGSDAKDFNPSRFSDGIMKATGGNMSFFSFGWGPRICIGSNFAMIEAKMTVALILRRFSLHLSPSYAHAPTTSRGTLRPQFGAYLILRRL